MPITAKQRTNRRNHLGSSDVAAICGMSPFQNAYDVWLEKTGQLDEVEQAKPWLDSGNEFEPIILKRAERALGPIRKNQYRAAKGLGFPLASHIDAIVTETGRPVEAKACGLFWPVQEEWGEPGTNQVPDRVILQAQVHLIVTGKDICHVPAMFWGLKQELYLVERDGEMIGQLTEYLRRWWQEHVVNREPPEGTPSLEVIRRAKREPGKAVPIGDEAVARWRRFAAAETKIRKMKEAALADVLAGMGDAECATCALGTVTYRQEQRSGYTVEPSTIRVARFKKAK